MSKVEHNFVTLEYSFIEIDGQELTGVDCYLSENGCSIGTAGHGAIFPSEPHAQEQRRANARRIAACVNYCAGIDTEELENKSCNYLDSKG